MEGKYRFHTSPELAAGMPQKTLRVLVIGPALMADALTLLLTHDCDDIAVTSPLYDSAQALSALQQLPSVDVIIIQWNPAEEGTRIIEMLTRRNYRCLILTSFSLSAHLIAGMKQAGAWGIIEGEASITQLRTAIRGIVAGRHVFSNQAADKHSEASLPLHRNVSEAPHSLVFSIETLYECARLVDWALHARDIDILCHLFEGNEAIATALCFSVGSIRRSLSERIYDFLSLLSGKAVRDRATACRVALEWGIYRVASREIQER